MNLRNFVHNDELYISEQQIGCTAALLYCVKFWCTSVNLQTRISDCEIAKLQRVQNAAARLLMSCKKYDHVTPILINLHWLPVRYRTNFKILLLTFKALYGMTPSYIIDLINVKTNTRYSLRSSEGILLKHPSGRMKKSFGDRSFSVAAPTLWNALPASLRNIKCISTFKSNLKTYLFKLAFSIS